MKNENFPESWLSCSDRKEWRYWLNTNHATEPEIWLKIIKVNSKVDGIKHGEAVEEAICFGWIDGKLYSFDDDSFLLRFTPRRPGSIWSLINRDRAKKLMKMGKMTEAGMEKVREAKENGNWQAAYSSKVEPEIPDDLKIALKGDPVAERNFNMWTNSQKLQLITWLEDSKQTKTRIDRIKKIIDKTHEGSN